MNIKYKTWISEYLTKNNPYGQCAEATLQMQKEFPELIRVRGHYYEPLWGQDREHWWLKTKNNEIVDPTSKQFPTNGTMEYTEWVEGSEEPIGKCMNCGDLVFSSKDVGANACSKRCHLILMEDFK